MEPLTEKLRPKKLDEVVGQKHLIGEGKLPEKSKYRYFLKGSTTINENHTPSGKFTDAGQVFTYPVLSEQDYE